MGDASARDAAVMRVCLRVKEEGRCIPASRVLIGGCGEGDEYNKYKCMRVRAALLAAPTQTNSRTKRGRHCRKTSLCESRRVSGVLQSALCRVLEILGKKHGVEKPVACLALTGIAEIKYKQVKAN